jgi:hypothetical protein
MRADMVNRGPYIYYTSNTIRTMRYRVPSNNTMRTRIELNKLHVVFHHAIQHNMFAWLCTVSVSYLRYEGVR